MIYPSSHRYSDSFVAMPEDGSGFIQGSEERILNALNGNYSRKAGGYVLPISKRAFLEALLEKGWKARIRVSKDCPSVFIAPTGINMTYNQAKKLLLP